MTALDASTQELAAEDEQVDLVSEVSFGIPKSDNLQTDTSDVGELFCSCGAEMPVNQATFIFAGSESCTNPEEAVTLHESEVEEVTSINPRPGSPPDNFLRQGKL